MPIFRISSEEASDLNDFVISQKCGNVHQSWNYGDFQSTIKGREKFWVVILKEEGKIKASALVIRMETFGGKFWMMCPRGPVMNYENEEQLKEILNEVEKIGREEGAIFVRIESPLPQPVLPDLAAIFKSAGYCRAHYHHQPENTLIIDLTKTEEEILAGMKQKGRYNIKVARKKGVEVGWSEFGKGDWEADCEIFFELVRTTTKRNKFSGHGVEYYKNMVEKLDGVNGPRARVYLARHEGDVLAGLIVTFYGKKAIYYFGASSSKKRNLMAPYLAQWKAIEDAKAMGCESYDFFGIAPEGAKNHPWQKISEFKLKLGGERVNYWPAREKILSPLWYWLMRGAKLGRKLMGR